MAKKFLTSSSWQIGFVVAFILCFVFLSFWNQRAPRSQEFVLKGEPVELYVAKTLKDTYRGLGKRDDLDGKDGMLFLFEYAGKHGIVMRDMRFPIDIVWLDAGKVVDIVENAPVQPGATESELVVYRPALDATMVLELPAGWVRAHGLEVGDVLTNA